MGWIQGGIRDKQRHQCALPQPKTRRQEIEPQSVWQCDCGLAYVWTDHVRAYQFNTFIWLRTDELAATRRIRQ